MNPEIQQLKAQIAELAAEVQKLKSFATVPLEVEGALRNRLGVDGLQKKLFNGDDDINDFLQAVNESGASSYNVPLEPDYILRAKYLNVDVGILAYDI